MRDALKSYLALAAGVTDLTRQAALAAARALVSQGEATAEQVTGLAEDLLAQTRQNREAVVALVSYEVDRALGRVGLASADEVVALTQRVRELEGQLRSAASAVVVVAGQTTAGAGDKPPTAADAPEAGAGQRPEDRAPARRAAAKRAATTKAVRRRRPAADREQPTPTDAAETPAAADGARADEAPVQQAPMQEAPAKKAPAKKAAAKKTAPAKES